MPNKPGDVFVTTWQTGIDLAGQRINRIQTEYAKVSENTTVVPVGGRLTVQAVAPGGQFSLFPPEPSGLAVADDVTEPADSDPSSGGSRSGEFDLGGFFNPPPDGPTPAAGGGARSRPVAPRHFSYALRPDAPRVFQTQELSDDNAATEEDCAQRFMISTRNLFEAIRSKARVERRTLEVFSGQLQLDLMGADLEPGEIERRALRALQHSPVFDPRELRRALRIKVEAVLREEFLDEANDPAAVGRTLDTLLALHPEMLHEAQRSALAKHARIIPAEPLPLSWDSDEALGVSSRNVYGIMPAVGEAINTVSLAGGQASRLSWPTGFQPVVSLADRRDALSALTAGTAVFQSESAKRTVLGGAIFCRPRERRTEYPLAVSMRNARAPWVPGRLSCHAPVTRSAAAASWVNSTTCHGNPCALRSAMKASGSCCSMFQTPGLRQDPSSICLAPIIAGTPVV